MSKIIFITVFKNINIYNKLILDNKFTQDFKKFPLDNNPENKHIPVRYNEFLNNYNYQQEAWFVFCHEDWELKDSGFQDSLNKLEKNSIYGPIGVKLKGIRQVFFNKFLLFPSKLKRHLRGAVIHSNKDGSCPSICGCFIDNSMNINNNLVSKSPVDTLDCQCLIIHSSLVEKYNLRFDENLSFDLYAEDFCINSKRKYNITSYAINIFCQHHSKGNITDRYYKQLEYLSNKYKNRLYGGAVSIIGGGERINSYFK